MTHATCPRCGYTQPTHRNGKFYTHRCVPAPKRNSLVKIGKGTKVYRVAKVVKPEEHNYSSHPDEARYVLAADAQHPDAAVRLHDALVRYRADQLVPVEPIDTAKAASR